MYPTLRAVKSMGGSATSREIEDEVIRAQGFDDDALAITYDGRDDSVLLERIQWARSYCKLSGLLDSPKRGLFLLSSLGQELLEIDEAAARERLRELDREVRAERRRRTPPAGPTTEEDEPVGSTADDEPDEGTWRADLLARLHQLPPDGFEEFVIYVLKAYGMELERVGGSGDEGIDGIGSAPISDVLSSRVAVQAKRYDPSGTPIGRDVVALFQRDAQAAGAERAVLVTLARVSSPARRAAIQSTPNVEIIDGNRLAELVRKEGIGIRDRPQVDGAWFDRFE